MDNSYYILKRLKNLRRFLLYNDLDAMLISYPQNVSYTTFTNGVEAAVLVTASEQFFITDFRYLEQTKKTIPPFFAIVELKDCFFKSITDLIISTNSQRCGFEAKRLAYEEFVQIDKRLKKPFRLVATYDVVESMRLIKDEKEILLIKNSINITNKTLNFCKRILKIGLTEYDIQIRLQDYMRQKGAKAAFDIIVASGARSSMPHAPISNKKICCNTIILIDLGANINGYNSDLTRVFVLGKIKTLYKEIIKIVDVARKEAIAQIHPGVKANFIDSIARSYITSKGFGKFFGHSLGHGIGLEVHEGPSISGNSKDVLKEGMVFTIEPAIYIPKVGGVRIEDVVLVTKRGCKVLSR